MRAEVVGLGVAIDMGVPMVDRVALVAGATGLVGQAVLAGLLTDNTYCAVHWVGRRAPKQWHAKLIGHVCDLGSPVLLPGVGSVDDVFIALGTTIKVAGSPSAFRAVDFDAVLAVAKTAKALGATKLGVISAIGARCDSKVFYSRVKGEMEEAITKLGFQALVIARPSMLAGDRAALFQQERPAERIGLHAMRLLRHLLPANYRAIAATDVARALLGAMQSAQTGKRILLSGEMQPVG